MKALTRLIETPPAENAEMASESSVELKFHEEAYENYLMDCAGCNESGEGAE